MLDYTTEKTDMVVVSINILLIIEEVVLLYQYTHIYI